MKENKRQRITKVKLNIRMTYKISEKGLRSFPGSTGNANIDEQYQMKIYEPGVMIPHKEVKSRKSEVSFKFNHKNIL